MLGLGETDDELKEAMDDLRAIDVDILTLGQYLQVNESESLCHDNLLVENYRRLTASSAWTLEEAVSVLCGESVIIHLLIPRSFSQSCCSQLHFTWLWKSMSHLRNLHSGRNMGNRLASVMWPVVPWYESFLNVKLHSWLKVMLPKRAALLNEDLPSLRGTLLLYQHGWLRCNLMPFFSVSIFQVRSSYRAGELFVKTMVKERASVSSGMS